MGKSSAGKGRPRDIDPKVESTSCAKFQANSMKPGLTGTLSSAAERAKGTKEQELKFVLDLEKKSG